LLGKAFASRFGSGGLPVQLPLGGTLAPVPFHHVLDDHEEQVEQADGGQQGRQDHPAFVQHLGHHASGLRKGKRIVSRIPDPVSSMSTRSSPIPSPPMGGLAYSSARRKSSSSCIASTSPPAASRDCSVRRARWTSGSTSSVKP